MKHTLRITIILVILFFAAHMIGLYITSQYLSQNLPYGIERPELKESTSYIPLIIAILVATGIALLLVRFGAMKLWKFWFIFATVYLLAIAFSAFMAQIFALLFALILGLLKLFRPNVLIHNFTELFVYSGIVAIFAPVMSVFAASVLLILISIYDYIAVWKTKHMVKMAEFQAKSRMFAGFLIPYSKNKTAILGGGDIAFTLLFSGVVLTHQGFLNAVIVSLFTSIALLLLFIFSKKKKFYPAMPFLSVGCFIGLLAGLLV
jgi:presenilin-like A22 family membrane protease